MPLKKQKSEKETSEKGFFSRLLNKSKKKNRDTNNSDNILTKEVINNKTIILIGSTGSGKSTLANVISDTNKFIESESSRSVTKEVQKEGFTESGINYVAIDTVGIGDTQLKREEVLDKLAEAVYWAKDGISQVIFVISGRFDEKEIVNYNLLKSIIFDNSVVNHTTVIRTNFKNFEKIDDREKDKDSLLAHQELNQIINSCNGIIHVDNPSLDLAADVSKRAEKLEKRKVTRVNPEKYYLSI